MGEKKRIEYPSQIPLPEWAPDAKLSEAERRREAYEDFFEMEKLCLEEEFPSDLVYDTASDVFRFPGGAFALSREHADWAGLKRIGYFRAWGL